MRRSRPATEHSGRLSKAHQRDGGGLTATFGLGDERVVRVYQGTLTHGRSARGESTERSTHTFAQHVQAAIADCRGLGPDWRILSLSTPVSILRDLRGPLLDSRVRQSSEAEMVPREHHDVLAPHLLGAYGAQGAA